MKIIGEAGQKLYIVQMSEEEWGCIQGAQNVHHPAVRPSLGAEIKVASVFNHLREQRDIPLALEQFQAKLRRFADLLEVPPAIAPVLPKQKDFKS